MPIFLPSYLFKDITHITPQFLQQKGIYGLVLDVDNTLTADHSQYVAPEILAWITQMNAHNIHMLIASNGKDGRVAPFAAKLGLDYFSSSAKPLPFALIKARKKWALSKNEIAMVGDQIFTDCMAANLYGIRSLVVQPLQADVDKSIRLKRKFETPILNQYFKKGGKLL